MVFYLNKFAKTEKMSFCHTLYNFSTLYQLATRCCRSLIFQTMNSARSNSLSLKYHRFTPSSCKDIGIRIFEFVAKTQFLSERFSKIKSVLNISKCRSNVLSKMSVPLSLMWFYHSQLSCLKIHAVNLLFNVCFLL